MLKKVRGLKNNYKPRYIDDLGLPVEEHLVLLEGGQGTNLNGNMFALLKELQTNPRYADFTAVFTVTEKNREQAKQRMALYGFDRVTLAVRNSSAYCRALATAKYLLTDNTFPPYFNKRPEQVVVNTWHGTPLKTLGKASRSGFASLANVQKNYLMTDYALFPNEFTKEVFMQDYDLRPLFRGHSVVANYPRNSVFYDAHAGAEMKKRLGLADKRVFAYMPTWRDGADVAQQLARTKAVLQEFDRLLDDSSVLLVNLHFLLMSSLDCGAFSHIRYFPGEYETYEVLNACDGLITDYSSVFFDYAVTGKKVILFAYDKEEYLAARGTYMPLETLPFPLVERVEDAVAEMDVSPVVLQEFLDTYCPAGGKHVCRDLLDLMISGQRGPFNPVKETPAQNLCLVYGGRLPSPVLEGLRELVRNNPQTHYVVAYRGILTREKKQRLDALGAGVSVYGLLNTLQLKPWEWLGQTLGRNRSSAGKREAGRLFAGITPREIIDGIGVTGVLSHVLKALSALVGCPMNRADWLAKQASMTPVLPWYFTWGGKLRCFTLFLYKTGQQVDVKQTVLRVGDQTVPRKLWGFSCKKGTRHGGLFAFSLPMQDLITMPANNPVGLGFYTPSGELVSCHARYCWLPLNVCVGLRSIMAKEKDTQTVAIFRQMPGNRLNVYVRSANVSDRLWYRTKQITAWFVALFWQSKKAKSLVLLFEKNGAKYEESASVLFEELLAMGCTNAYFIVDKKYEFLDRVPEPYRGNLLYKHTFRHYLYFFKAKTFIGTEAIAHAIDLKTFNALPLLKIVSRKLNYVFLQHGVMYMVSLNSEAREVFAPKKMKGKYKYRVVTSSQTEADHFMTLGGYERESLYVCGLPKFDRNRRREDADKIVIMPTWRPWEINEARRDFTATGYYKMLMTLYHQVPRHLQEKVVILPHPLVLNELGKLPRTVAEKMAVNARYDDILQETAVLVTDYSSIAYDAFYRGANVVFYWEEKDACMAQYGPSTRLMLNEENVYGDVAVSPLAVGQLIEANYKQPQREVYRERYNRIVAFHDGNNTRRLIELLQKDGMIERYGNSD